MIVNLPKVVPPAEWQAARDRLLVKEKAVTRELDALAAERRRLPMVQIDKDYVFTTSDGEAHLIDLFEGRRQLLLYHFMLAPGETHVCEGCASFADNIGNLAHVHARDTTLVLVSRAPPAEIQALQRRTGWTMPWYSSNASDFNHDFGLTTEDGESFGLSAFVRDGDDVFRTYFTSARGVDRLRADFNLLDLTAFGRQEDWEDSPDGWPKTAPRLWWRLHDRATA